MPPFSALIERIGQPRTLQTGQAVFRQGDRDTNVYLVRRGLLKASYLHADGKDQIKSFLPEGSMIGSMVALVDGDPCTFGLTAMEDSETVSLPFAKLKEAARSDIDLANALVDFLCAYGKKKERREYELLTLSPEERYRQLRHAFPEVAERVSLADIAAHIGITPQALSRIRRRMAERTD